MPINFAVSGFFEILLTCVVVRHRVDAGPDPDPIFHFDADPDPSPSLNVLKNQEKIF